MADRFRNEGIEIKLTKEEKNFWKENETCKLQNYVPLS